jgi:hypothetical protein
MSASIDIKDQIINKIESLASVQVVYPAPQNNPSGWPAVVVTSTDMEGEFSSNLENSRVYAYDVLIMFPQGQDFVPESERNRLDYAERVVAQVIDEIINAIDTDFELDGSPVLFVNAADCEWGAIEYEGGVAKAAIITLRVYTEVTI